MAATYAALGGSAKKGPPKKNCILGALTSGWARLFVLVWAAYTLTLLAMTWYGVTAYHLTGSSIQDNEGSWGQFYDLTRSASKAGITVTSVISDTAQGKANQKLDEDAFNIVSDTFEEPKGWQATLIHGWMILATSFNTLIALVTWVIVVKNALVTVCGITRLDTNQELREHRQELASDVALGWNLAVPLVSWAIQYATGYKHCGIASSLYHRMVSLGPMVMVGQKILVFVMTTLKDAEKNVNSSGDVAWNLCGKSKVKDMVRQVKRSALEIYVQSQVLKAGPALLQEAAQGAFLALNFETRPFGLVLGILGFVDSVVVSKLTSSILGVIPSWLDEELAKVEGKLKEIGQDAAKLNKELDEHLRTIKDVVDKADSVVATASKGLKTASKLVAKHSKLFGESMTKQMEQILKKVEVPLNELLADVDEAKKEVWKVEATLEKNANIELAVALQKIKALTGMIERFTPERCLYRLEKMSDNDLYGEIVEMMTKENKRGAPSLGYAPAPVPQSP